MMTKLLNWIEDKNWIRQLFRGFPMALIISLITLGCYAASTASKIYMRDKNLYFVLDATKDNFLNMNPLGDVANMLFGFHKWIIKVVSWLIEQSYTFDLYQLIDKQFNTLFEPIKNTFWTGFFPIAGGIFVLSLLILITFHGRASTAFEGFVKGIAIIAFALWFMQNPSKSMSGLKDVTDGVNAELVKNSYKEVKVEDQYKEIADQFYKTYVVEIWRILNFSSVGLDNEDIKSTQVKYEDRLLSAAPGTDEREKLTDELREEVKISESSWIGNMFLVILLSIPDEIIMTLLSGINLSSDVFTIGLALMAPIIFLFAILPNYGSRLFMSWLSKILFFFAITVATTIILTYYIGLTNILLDNRSQLGGLIGVLAVKDVILIGAYIFREKFVFAIQSAVQGRRGMERSLDQMSMNKEVVEGKNRVIDKAVVTKDKAVTKAINYRKKSLENKEKERLKTNGVGPLKMTSEARNNLAEEALNARLQHRMVTAQNEAVEKEERFGIKFEPDYGDLTEHVRRYEAGEDPFTGAERRKMVSDIDKHESAWGDPKEFVDKYKVDFARMNSDQRRAYSEDYLRRRFEERKTLAEEESKESGGLPKYDEWTKTKIDREQRGESIFTEKELDTFSENIRKSEKSGENVQKTLRHKFRKTTDHINPEKEYDSSEETTRGPTTRADNTESKPRDGSQNIEEININHTYAHNYEHTIHNNSRVEGTEQTVDIRNVKKTTGLDNKGSHDFGDRSVRQNSDKAGELKANETIMRSINEVIKNQHEDKKDMDETQEQIREIQRNAERQERNVKAKINKLEGEQSEEKEEE